MEEGRKVGRVKKKCRGIVRFYFGQGPVCSLASTSHLPLIIVHLDAGNNLYCPTDLPTQYCKSPQQYPGSRTTHPLRMSSSVSEISFHLICWSASYGVTFTVNITRLPLQHKLNNLVLFYSRVKQ